MKMSKEHATLLHHMSPKRLSFPRHVSQSLSIKASCALFKYRFRFRNPCFPRATTCRIFESLSQVIGFLICDHSIAFCLSSCILIFHEWIPVNEKYPNSDGWSISLYNQLQYCSTAKYKSMFWVDISAMYIRPTPNFHECLILL